MLTHLNTRTLFAVLALSIGSLVTSGCSTLKQAERLTDRNERACSSPVVGSLTSRDGWGLRTPAIVLASNRDVVVYGDEFRLEGDSLYFDAARLSPFVNPEPRWYATSDLAVAVNPQGDVVVGQVPQRFRESWTTRWNIRPAGTQLETMWMRAQDEFAYCLQAGTYEVSTLSMSNPDGYTITSYEGPWFTFDVEEGHTNDLGDWVFDTSMSVDSTSVVVLARITSRPSNGLALAFGLVGALAELAMQSGLNNEVRPVFRYTQDEVQNAVGGQPSRFSTITKTRQDLLPGSQPLPSN